MNALHRVLIAGAGVAGLEATLALRELAGDRVDIDVVAPEAEFTYRSLAVAEPFASGEPVRFELASLVTEAGARLRRDAVTAVEPERHAVRTASGEELTYDSLVITCGARPVPSIPGALIFGGPADRSAFTRLLDELASGRTGAVVFALPGGAVWPVPLYELALLTSAHVAASGGSVRITLVTPEAEPLRLFGPAAATEMRRLLDERGIELVTGVHPVAVEPGGLAVTAGGRVEADHVVTLPRLLGPALEGLPCDTDGFVPTDVHGSVAHLAGVYAAGDATTFPVKQGGIAAQQADAVAEVIASRVGARVTPRPFRPVLRGLLLTGGRSRYLRTEMTSGHGDTSEVALEALWWPPSKVSGRHLAPFLAARVGEPGAPPEPGSGLAVDVDLELA